MSVSKGVFFIGYNGNGEFGSGNTDSVDKLTPFPNKSITKIFPSRMNTIYADNNFDNIWVAGFNKYGQLGSNTNSASILNLTPLTYFTDNNIKIKNISVAITGDTTFFFTNSNKVYGTGSNTGNELGLENKPDGDNRALEDQFEPVLIELNDIIDIKSSPYFSIALCASDDETLSLIINHWSRLYTVPDDVTSLIITFSKFSKVFSTVYDGHGHGDDFAAHSDYGWKEIEALNNKNIIKISVGYKHTLYLTSYGAVYSCGANHDGECGHDAHIKDTNTPSMIEYFEENKIKIVDIKAGCYHNLVLDDEGKIYSFGYNAYGQWDHSQIMSC